MSNISVLKTDKQGYDAEYAKHTWDHQFDAAENKEQYIQHYATLKLSPFYRGGTETAYRVGRAVKMMIEAADALGRSRGDITVLDAGCGRGELSAYLACLGFRVVGVDISSEACVVAKNLAERLGIRENCRFIAKSLDNLPLEDNSVDFVVGAETLHHFIKYEGVPAEFLRIMKNNAYGFFADPFQENILYRVFHDKEKMERLGDCLLNKKFITEYFKKFDVDLMPTDWFVMTDKLIDRVFGFNFLGGRRKLSTIFFHLDRCVPSSSRAALLLSGSVITTIRRPDRPQGLGEVTSLGQA